MPGIKGSGYLDYPNLYRAKKIVMERTKSGK